MTSTDTDTSTATARDLLTARHLINGEWLGGADTERMNPARPGELAALSPSGTAADVDAAITAAAAAQPAWAATARPVPRRHPDGRRQPAPGAPDRHRRGPCP